ncbi:MAG: lamin tail domain-containing protein [Patescibacteria group bacterium]
MILINEWLPNPGGPDMAGEWIELFNSGEEPVDVSSWKITSGDGKFYIKSVSISGREYLLLKREDTKLVLKNIDGELRLHDAQGKLQDQALFLGSAPEGKSFGKIVGEKGGQGEFLWLSPTPGAENSIPMETGIIRNEYPYSTPLNKQITTPEFFGLMIGSALTLTALIMFILRRDENLFKLFFGGDEKIR